MLYSIFNIILVDDFAVANLKMDAVTVATADFDFRLRGACVVVARTVVVFVVVVDVAISLEAFSVHN